MPKKYQKQFLQFLSEVKQIKKAKNAEYQLSDEVKNVIIISGEIIGNKTRDRINEVGKKYGLLVLAQELSVMYEQDEI